jgi:hypothetical protein
MGSFLIHTLAFTITTVTSFKIKALSWHQCRTPVILATWKGEAEIMRTAGQVHPGQIVHEILQQYELV